MKRTVLAIAVGAALAMAGVAQADVTIFGKVHVSLDSIDSADAAAPTKNKSYMYVSSNSSSLGFKEEEDLGDGMKAGLFFDTGITADAHAYKGGTAAIFDRQTYGYLAGGFGQVSIGKVETAMKTLGGKADFFRDQVGDNRDLIADKKNNIGFDWRSGNAVQYMSPNMGGVQATVTYVPEEGVKDASGMDLRVDFSQGPIFVGVAYQSHGKALVGTPSTTISETESGMRLAAAYTMGDMKVAGLIQTETNRGGLDGNDRTTWGIGGSFKVTANDVVKVQYYSAGELDGDSNGATAGGTANKNTDGTMLAIGFDHAMSKKTTVYAAYAMTTNESAAAFNATAGGHGSEQTTAPATGEDSSAISFGFIHNI